MSRISTLLASCGRGPALALAVAAGAAFGLGFLAANSGGIGGGRGHTITVQEGGNGNQEGQDGAGEMDPAAMMEMMAQLGAPDEHHEQLKVFVGTWKTEMKALTPGMEAFNSTGSATFESAMGGRFVTQKFAGSMMGQDFKGVGISGYNKAAKRHEALWHDDMGTAMYFMTGQKTDDGWAYEGQETDPMSGETYTIRHVIKMDGRDRFSFIMQYPPAVAAQMGAQPAEGQKWVDAFRIDYTRTGGAEGGAAPGGMGRNRGGGNQNRGGGGGG